MTFNFLLRRFFLLSLSSLSLPLPSPPSVLHLSSTTSSPCPSTTPFTQTPNKSSAMTKTVTIAPRQLPLQIPPIARNCKCPVQYSVSCSEVQVVDAAGRTRDIIVIEDTPPPSAQQGLPLASAFKYLASQSAGTVTVSPACSTPTT